MEKNGSTVGKKFDKGRSSRWPKHMAARIFIVKCISNDIVMTFIQV